MPLSNCRRRLSVAPVAQLERRGSGTLGGGGSAGGVQDSLPEVSHFIRGTHPFSGLLSHFHPGQGLGAGSGVSAPEGSYRAGSTSFTGLLQPVICDNEGLGVVATSDRPFRLNLQVYKTLFKMETIQSTLLSVRRGDWMVSLDLKDAYFQNPIHLESRKFLRFMVLGNVYQFKVLCFGLSTAPQVFTRVMAPVLRILHSLGVRLRRYLDDWLIQASSWEQVILALRTVLRLCNRLGIVVNWEKSQLVPTQRICYLGVLLDTVSGLLQSRNESTSCSQLATCFCPPRRSLQNLGWSCWGFCPL